MAQRQPHKGRKRILTSLYSKSTLYTSPEIRKISRVLLVERLLPTIESAVRKQISLDALEHSLAISIDFITGYLFGIGNSTNFLQDVGTRKRWLHAHDRIKGQKFWSLEFPRLAALLGKFRVNSPAPEIESLTKEVKNLCLQLMENTEASTSPLNGSSAHDRIKWTRPVVYEQLLQHLQPAPQTRLIVASELMDHIMAGTETSGWTLTYIMYELSLRPQLQSTLRSELLSLASPMVYTDTSVSDQTPLATSDFPSPRDLDSLSLLDAIVLESLRRYPAVAGAQPRTSRSRSSLGRWTDIPPGIRVSAQAYSLHRNTEVFPDPESWIPMRWLTCDEESRERMMRFFWAFGSGGRMCIGNHFAMIG